MKKIPLFLGSLLITSTNAMDYLTGPETYPSKWTQNDHDFYEINPNVFNQKEFKELSTENKRLYKLNIHLNNAVSAIKEAHPILLAWTKSPHEKQTVERLPGLSTILQEQTNTIEIWLRQVNLRNTTSFTMLRDTIEAFEKSLNTIQASQEKNDKLAQIIAEDLSHPVSHFFHIFVLLKELVGT